MAVASTMRITDLAGNELYSVGAFTPTVLSKLDVGFPTSRAVTTNRSGGNGTSDTTQFWGDRAIVAELTMAAPPNTDSAVDTLAGLMNPAARYYLYMQRPGWTGERRTLVRGASFACPPGTVRLAQAGWVAPSGTLEDSVLSQVGMSPTGSGSGGVTFPVTFPMVFDPGLVPGAAQVNVGGTVPTPIVAYLFGPCSAPLLRCVTTGQQISFGSLSIAAGDYLEVDTGARTATLNSDPNQSRYSAMDFGTSMWWQLPPGAVQIVFSPSTPSGNCQALVTWRGRWL